MWDSFNHILDKDVFYYTIMLYFVWYIYKSILGKCLFCNLMTALYSICGS